MNEDLCKNTLEVKRSKGEKLKETKARGQVAYFSPREIATHRGQRLEWIVSLNTNPHILTPLTLYCSRRHFRPKRRSFCCHASSVASLVVFLLELTLQRLPSLSRSSHQHGHEQDDAPQPGRLQPEFVRAPGQINSSTRCKRIQISAEPKLGRQVNSLCAIVWLKCRAMLYFHFLVKVISNFFPFYPLVMHYCQK